MFKLVVFLVLIAYAAARPGLLAPTLYNSAVVGSVPTSVSAHSTSVVHGAALTPILHAAPVVHSALVASPAVVSAGPAVVSAYSAPALSVHPSPLAHAW